MLKTMNIRFATININDFTYAIICGCMERNFKLNGDLRIEMNLF